MAKLPKYFYFRCGGNTMKKSIEAAAVRAQKWSVMHPGRKVWVFDKKGKQACICLSNWVWRERILDGWNIIMVFRDGRRI